MDTLTLQPRPVWLPIVVALLLGGSFVAGKKIEKKSEPARIYVTGEGRVSAVPDIAQLSFGVQTGRQKTAQLAMENLSKAMGAILAAVKAEGVEDKDIVTESLWLNPAYDWIDGSQVPRGFEASQSLRVKVRDLEKIGTILSAAAGAGANQAGGVSFTIDDPEVLRAQAREKAIRQAQEKAQTLASQLGARLGELRDFSEGGGVQPPMPMYARMEGRGGYGGDAADISVPSGEQEVFVGVTLSYEIK